LNNDTTYIVGLYVLGIVIFTFGFFVGIIAERSLSKRLFVWMQKELKNSHKLIMDLLDQNARLTNQINDDEDSADYWKK
jgi:hypothetical protein